MLKKLAKLGTSLATMGSTFYWGALPALAANDKVPLCPPATQPQPPGCKGGSPVGVDTGKIIQSAINLLFFVAFVVALIFLIIGGIKWMLSGGDKEGAGKAKETVTAALIGLAVVIGSWILINILFNFFGVSGGLSDLIIPVLKWEK